MINALYTKLFTPTGPIDDAASGILWCLANIADDMHDLSKIRIILQMPYLMWNVMLLFLDEKYPHLHSPTLRLIGNIAVGDDEQTDRLLSEPLMPDVIGVAMFSEKHKSEIAWICSNIAAGRPQHVDFLVSRQNFYEWVLQGAHSSNRRLKKECLWIIANMISTADEKIYEWLIGQGVVCALPMLLSADDVRLNEKALAATVHILNRWPYQKPLLQRLDIISHINPELFQDDAPSPFQAHKRIIEESLKGNPVEQTDVNFLTFSSKYAPNEA